MIQKGVRVYTHHPGNRHNVNDRVAPIYRPRVIDAMGGGLSSSIWNYRADLCVFFLIRFLMIVVGCG
jgi:hypothetical protein